jgi:hypothetical protein
MSHSSEESFCWRQLRETVCICLRNKIYNLQQNKQQLKIRVIGQETGKSEDRKEDRLCYPTIHGNSRLTSEFACSS